MKAIVYERYGPPEVLEVRETDEPVPGEHDVLIRVHAASINASDWETLRGKPLYARLPAPFKPKNQILGSDVAGRVAAVGSGVERFRPGDEVFGDTMWHGAGGFAEYVSVNEGAPLVPKPAGMTFQEAAAVPQAGVIALQGLGKGVGIRQGDRILINGAGGGAGTFAVQLAKLYGAEVTGVDHGGKEKLLRSLGADHVIDYTREDFTRGGRRYDLILDIVAQRSPFACKRALTPGGRYAAVGGSMAAMLQAGLLGPVVSRLGKQRIGLLMAQPNREDLTHVADLITGGSISPIIERTYHLEDVPEALRHLGEGRALGKLVITIVPEDAG